MVIVVIMLLVALLIATIIITSRPKVYYPPECRQLTHPHRICRSDEESLNLLKIKFQNDQYLSNNIFQVWIPNKPENKLPSPYFRQIMDTVIDTNTGWDIFFIGEKCTDYIWSKYRNYDSTMETLYNTYSNYAVLPVQRNDLIRLALLYLFGGVYIDGDAIVNHNLTTLVGSPDDQTSRLIFAKATFALSNCFVASFPRNNTTLSELIKNHYYTVRSMNWIARCTQWSHIMLIGTIGLRISSLLLKDKSGLYLADPRLFDNFTFDRFEDLMNGTEYSHYTVIHISASSHMTDKMFFDGFRLLTGRNKL